MKGLKSIVLVVAIVPFLLAVGCSNAASPTASPPTTTPTQAATPAPKATSTQPATSAPTTTPTQPATSAPTTTPTQPASQLPLALGAYINVATPDGPMRVTLLDGGHYTELVSYDGREIEGTWTLAGDHITFTETKGGLCTGVQGSYTWAFDGKALTFRKVQDDCGPRSGDWPSGPWKWLKQP